MVPDPDKKTAQVRTKSQRDSLPRPEQPPGRRYADLLGWDPFTGGAPRGPKPVRTKEQINEPLTKVCYGGWSYDGNNSGNAEQAWLRHDGVNIKWKDPDKKLSAGNTFEVMDEDRKKTLVKATVLRIEQQDFFFQVDEDIYAIHVGDSLAKALKRPLSSDDIDKYDLRKLSLSPLEKQGNGGKIDVSVSGEVR